jgi:gluconate 2-dehydrogenase subunit 3-like protein
MGRVSRRAFLIGGAGVAAIGATGATALFAPFSATRGRRWLTETEAAAALALAKTLFSEGPTPEEADVLGRLDAAVGDLHPQTRKLFKTGLRALEYAPLPRFLSRFSRLSAEARTACVKSWEKKPYLWSAALLSLRFQVGMAYFESDAARAACEWRLGCTPSGAEN